MNFKSVWELVKEATPAATGTAATGLLSTLVNAPSVLTSIGQAAIVVIFTVKAIDKRLERLHRVANRALALAEVTDGKIEHLPCMQDPVLCKACRDRALQGA